MGDQPKEIAWIGSSLKDLREFPEDARREIGFALRQAQNGSKHPDAKPFKGIKSGASVLEIVDDFDTNTYRAVYPVAFEEAVYVLHCFVKKSKEGRKTPQQEVNLINTRFKAAQAEHETWIRLQSQIQAVGQRKRETK